MASSRPRVARFLGPMMPDHEVMDLAADECMFDEPADPLVPEGDYRGLRSNAGSFVDNAHDVRRTHRAARAYL